MSGKKCKDPEFIRKLIDIYQRHPALWKVKAKCYANRDLRKKGYDELLKHFKTGDSNATQETVRNKINNLRSAFRKEFKRIKSSKKTGSSTDDVYAPNLWYYDLLLFTAHQEEPRNTVSSNKSDDDENTQSENDFVDESLSAMSPLSETVDAVANESHISTASTPTRDPSRSETDADASQISTASSSTTLPSRSSHVTSRSTNSDLRTPVKKKIKRDDLVEAAYKQLTKGDDECEAVGTAISYKLRRMQEKQRNIAEYLINQILFFGVNRLDESTYICFPPKSSQHYGPPTEKIALVEAPDHTSTTDVLDTNTTQFQLRDYLKF
ncbi:hypothetical protein NQ314_001055 [Rhamnusium bicolor]|uniref:MADF domain-containing protein n=1 Tax=Rhamnusium bicolor TaxID=1586634 RepID=A0AAV8ZTA3_9CUCU|nr:hypothetical protein NQ314_001055 [Rhamnusium bicolor]